VHFFSTVTGSGLVVTPTNSWSDGNGKWETGANWSSGRAPSVTDQADVITNAGNNMVTIDATTSGSFATNLTIKNLIVAAPLNMTNTLLLSNAGTNTALVVSNSVSINTGGLIFMTNSMLDVGGPLGGALTVDGQLTMKSGTMSVSSNLLVGPSNPLSVVTIWGGAVYVTNAAHTALSEVRYGTLLLTGGVYFTDSLLITNASGNFINNGGTLTITGIGRVDQGTQTVASGTTQFSSGLGIGTSANSTGTVDITGGQLLVTNAPIIVGSLGNGSLTVSSGVVSTVEVDIGAGTNSQGTLTLQNGGIVTVSSNLTAGSASGSTGTVTISGGQLVVTNGTLGIGNNGTLTGGSGSGSMTVSNATVLASTILLGSSAGGAGNMTISDGAVVDFSFSTAGTNTSLVVNDLVINGALLAITNGTIYCGQTHPGAMILSNGAAVCQDVYVGFDSTGTMAMSGGTMSSFSRLIVGHLGPPFQTSASTGSVWITGGQLTITNNYSIIGNSGVGQMSISNGIVTMADVFVGNSSNPGTLMLAGGTLTVNSLLLLNPASRFNFNGGWFNALGITNSNGQMLTVGNGITPITLNLLGGISSLGNGLKIATNATFTGFGTINGSIVNYGTIMPGGATLTFTGIVTNNGLIITNSTVHFTGGLVNNGTVKGPCPTITLSPSSLPGGMINVPYNQTITPSGGSGGYTNSLVSGALPPGLSLNGSTGVITGTPTTQGSSTFTVLANDSNGCTGTQSYTITISSFMITAITKQGNDIRVTWTCASGCTNVLQSTVIAVGTSYSPNLFVDISPVIVMPGVGQSTTNYLDVGAASTNTSARYYRVRLVP